MSRRNKEFPNVSVYVNRHGTRSWRYRKTGCKTVYFAGVYGSTEFRQWYEVAKSGEVINQPKSKSADYGTFGWLIEQYRSSPAYINLAASSKKTQFNLQERFREEHGHRSVRKLESHHVEKLVAAKADTPSAANARLKLIKKLCRYGIRRGLITRDPTVQVQKLKENEDGYHAWTDAELVQFEEYHGFDSKAVRALRLFLYTGGTRADVAKMGWQTIRESEQGARVFYKRQKTKVEVNLPVLPELFEVLQIADRNTLLFITHGKGRAYKVDSLGNRFKEYCVAAGLPHCCTHGIRKNGASRMAEVGANELEIAAYLGHSNTDEARTYVKSANRSMLGDNAMSALNRANPVLRLTNRRNK